LAKRSQIACFKSAFPPPLYILYAQSLLPQQPRAEFLRGLGSRLALPRSSHRLPPDAVESAKATPPSILDWTFRDAGG